MDAQYTNIIAVDPRSYKTWLKKINMVSTEVKEDKIMLMWLKNQMKTWKKEDQGRRQTFVKHETK